MAGGEEVTGVAGGCHPIAVRDDAGDVAHGDAQRFELLFFGAQVGAEADEIIVLLAADVGMDAHAVTALLHFEQHIVAPFQHAVGHFFVLPGQFGAVGFEQTGVFAHQLGVPLEACLVEIVIPALQMHHNAEV